MANANHDLEDVKRRMQGAIAALKTELSGLRTGRASPHMLDPVNVDAYGAQMPLVQVSTVTVPEPRMMAVNVWDKSLVHAVEKAITAANLGLTPATEGQVIRLTADCPLADPGVIDDCVRLRTELGVDYASNGRRRTYPRGLDVALPLRDQPWSCGADV